MLKPNSPVTANLIKARELIADPKNWCQGVMFKRDAGQMCAVGAMWKATDVDLPSVDAMFKFLEPSALKLFGNKIVADINDNMGHAAVMQMFDCAIELSLQDA